MRRAAPALVVLLGAFVAGCAVLPVTRPVVKIGLAGPFQGPYRYVGYDAVYAARLALREANAAGGAGGYSVELVAYDDLGLATGARQASENLILDPQVVAVVGHFRDETTAVARPLYAEAGLPLVVAGTVEESAAGTLPASLVCPLLSFLQGAVDPEAFSVQWVGLDGTDASAAGIANTCEKSLPVASGTHLPPPPEVGAVILSLDPLAAGETVAALRAAGWDGVIAGGPGLGSPLFAQITDPTGVVFASPYRWPDVQGQDAAFDGAYRALGPHVAAPGPFALSTYQAAWLIVAGIASAAQDGGDVDRHVLAKHLSQPEPDAVFLYRWAGPDRLELVDQYPVARTRRNDQDLLFAFWH